MITDFIKIYLIEIIVYILILFIYTTDSMIPLVIYSILMHMALGISIYALYKEQLIVRENVSYKYILYSITEVSIFLVVLGVKEHWYTFIITCFQFCIHSFNLYEKNKHHKKLL